MKGVNVAKNKAKKIKKALKKQGAKATVATAVGSEAMATDEPMFMGADCDPGASKPLTGRAKQQAKMALKKELKAKISELKDKRKKTICLPKDKRRMDKEIQGLKGQRKAVEQAKAIDEMIVST